MKNFFAVVLLLTILFAILFSISAFLGRDLLLTLRREFDKRLNENGENNKPVLVQFAILSDTHSDSDNTKLALAQARNLGVEYIIHTGDWTTVGTITEFSEQKKLFDQTTLPYYGIMGDHDRWQSGSKNFEQILGKTYEAFERKGIYHILIDASDIDSGLQSEQLDWLEQQLAQADKKPIMIFMHLPIYHPTSDRTISSKAGISVARDENSKRFLSLIKGKSVKAIFSGDHHLSSSYTEPTTSVKIFISGAVTRERNLQKPRFSLVKFYQDFAVSVVDQIIN